MAVQGPCGREGLQGLRKEKKDKAKISDLLYSLPSPRHRARVQGWRNQFDLIHP